MQTNVESLLISGVCILLRVWDPGDGGAFTSTQRYYRSFFYLLLLKLLHASVYDHLQAEIYLLGFTRLTTDPLFLEYS
jgi:hypothetical protein